MFMLSPMYVNEINNQSLVYFFILYHKKHPLQQKSAHIKIETTLNFNKAEEERTKLFLSQILNH